MRNVIIIGHIGIGKLNTIYAELAAESTNIILLENTEDLPLIKFEGLPIEIAKTELPVRRDYDFPIIIEQKDYFLDDADFYKSRRKPKNNDWQQRIKNYTENKAYKMKQLLMALLFIQIGCECKKEKCGVITEVKKTGKSGEVMVLYPDGQKEVVKKRRPIQSMIGDEHCYCTE